ncbi:hypothetical protein F2Q69_00004887 [Brassica cretica]|uniref:peptidylprolyl isomerase n=1 Tax=Brassica cretica TaxID=69181 RepID=A0A8S9P9S0_BRACR|nr:hypothetical protein F2Q69_00004887 [Brassica cretica]
MGVEKQVIRPGTGAKPAPGQTVTVHCTGFGNLSTFSSRRCNCEIDLSKICLAYELFDLLGFMFLGIDLLFSTKDAGQKPFSFQIGKGAVIKGWDEGVMGMQIGEVARLRCSPDYAYGPGGFPAWGIQPNSVLDFEIEVLSVQ